MTESVFSDRAVEPTGRKMARTLGPRRVLWDVLIEAVECSVADLRPSWSYYTKATGWILLLQRGKKTVCTLIPREAEFDVIFLLPERAVEAARATRLPRRVLEAIEDAKPSKLGRAFRVHVRREADLPAVRKLAAIKAESWKR